MISKIIEYYSNNYQIFLDELCNHLLFLIGLPVLIDILIGITLGIIIYKIPKFKFILKIISALQVLPSIVLLTLMVLLGLGVGYKSAIIALIIYGLLPIISETYVGLNSIDNQYKITSDSLGFSFYNKLFKVELPLAMPYILSGIRLSALSISGLSVLANLVGAGGLGIFILTGIYQLQYHILIAGLIPSIIITWILDIFLLNLIEKSKI